VVAVAPCHCQKTSMLIAAVVVVEVVPVRTMMMGQLTSQRMTMMKNLHLKTCLGTGNWDPSTLHLRLVKKGECEFGGYMQTVKCMHSPVHAAGLVYSFSSLCKIAWGTNPVINIIKDGFVGVSNKQEFKKNKYHRCLNNIEIG